MEFPLKECLAKKVSEELRGRLVTGHPGEILPGVRVLAKTLGVSVPTVCGALHLLEENGWLESGGHRRRWRVSGQLPQEVSPANGSPAPTNRATARRRLLFLTPKPLGGESYSGVETFAALLDQLGTSDWEVMYRVESFTMARNPRRSWDELLRFSKPDALVVLGGTPAIGRWAVAKGIRTLFLGGEPGNSGVPIISVKVATMLRDAATRLFAAGHRQLLLPLCARSASFAATCRAVALEFEANDNTARQGKVVIAESKYGGPDVMIGLLRRQWRLNPPDAAIFLDWREFVAASGFFHQIGIDIPRDLSVILLSQNTSADWHLPPISHYEHPVKGTARAVAGWVKNEQGSRKPWTSQEMRARWVAKKSVAPRMAG